MDIWGCVFPMGTWWTQDVNWYYIRRPGHLLNAFYAFSLRAVSRGNILVSDGIWDKVFESGLSKCCGRQSLKNFKGYGLLKQTILLNFFKGCLPQNLLSPLFNTLSHIFLAFSIVWSDQQCRKFWIDLKKAPNV